jgi:hypothetical protein
MVVAGRCALRGVRRGGRAHDDVSAPGPHGIAICPLMSAVRRFETVRERLHCERTAGGSGERSGPTCFRTGASPAPSVARASRPSPVDLLRSYRDAAVHEYKRRNIRKPAIARTTPPELLGHGVSVASGVASPPAAVVRIPDPPARALGFSMRPDRLSSRLRAHQAAKAITHPGVTDARNATAARGA